MKRILILLLAISVPAMAHHGFFGFVDLTNPITFKGTVTRLEWSNPHVEFFVDVKDAAGKVTNWKFEAASPVALKNRGWARTDLKVGEQVTIVGYRAKDGSSVAAAGSVTFADGRTLDAASDGVPVMKRTPPST